MNERVGDVQVGIPGSARPAANEHTRLLIPENFQVIEPEEIAGYRQAIQVQLYTGRLIGKAAAARDIQVADNKAPGVVEIDAKSSIAVNGGLPSAIRIDNDGQGGRTTIGAVEIQTPVECDATLQQDGIAPEVHHIYLSQTTPGRVDTAAIAGIVARVADIINGGLAGRYPTKD